LLVANVLKVSFLYWRLLRGKVADQETEYAYCILCLGCMDAERGVWVAKEELLGSG